MRQTLRFAEGSTGNISGQVYKPQGSIAGVGPEGNVCMW